MDFLFVLFFQLSFILFLFFGENMVVKECAFQTLRSFLSIDFITAKLHQII